MRVAFVSMVGVALLLGGCARRDPYVTSAGDISSGAWRIATQTDRITGAPSTGASTKTMASNTFDPDAKSAMLQLTCFDGRPLVRFAFPFKIGSDANTVLGYRFDEKPGHDNVPGARFLQQRQIVVIEERNDVEQFVKDMQGSQLLYVRIRSIAEGRTTAEFKLDGSEAALEAAFKGCPLAKNPPTAEALPRRRES